MNTHSDLTSPRRIDLAIAMRKLRARLNRERCDTSVALPAGNRVLHAKLWLRRRWGILAGGLVLVTLAIFLRVDVQGERTNSDSLAVIGAPATLDSTFSVSLRGQERNSSEQAPPKDESVGEQSNAKLVPKPEEKGSGGVDSASSKKTNGDEGCLVEVVFRGVTLLDVACERELLIGARMGKEWVILRAIGTAVIPQVALSHEEWLEAYQGDYFDLDDAARAKLVPAVEAAVKTCDLYGLPRIRIRLEDGKKFAQVIGLLDDALRRRIAECNAGPNATVRVTFSRNVAGKLDLSVVKQERNRP